MRTVAETLQPSAAEGYSHSMNTLVAICPVPRSGTLAIDVLMNDKGAGAVETCVRVQSTSFTNMTRQNDDDDSRDAIVMPGGNEDKSKTETTDVDVITSRQAPDDSNNLGTAKSLRREK